LPIPKAGTADMSRVLCLLLLLASAFAAQPTHAAELLIDHVNGYTLDGAGRLQQFEALLIDDGKVVATGTHAALAARAKDATVIDQARVAACCLA
jgi:hypothetical protein